MDILLGVVLGVIADTVGAIILARLAILSRSLTLPKEVPDNRCIDSPWKIFGAIFLSPFGEEVLLRGPLLLIAWWFGPTSVFAIGFLIAEMLIFGIGHILVIGEQFVTAGWTEKEGKSVRIVLVLVAIWIGLVHSLLTLFYLSLLPAILAHSARNTIALISRKIGARGKSREEPTKNGLDTTGVAEELPGYHGSA